MVGIAGLYGMFALASWSALELARHIMPLPAENEVLLVDEARRVYQVALYNATHDVSTETYRMYLQAANLPVYSVQAVRLYAQAAEQGYAPAMTALGEFYEYGSPSDLGKALSLYHAAASQDYGPAQGRLLLYDIHHDSSVDYDAMQASAESACAPAESLIAKGIYLLFQDSDSEASAAFDYLKQGLDAFYNDSSYRSLCDDEAKVKGYRKAFLLFPQDEAALALYEVSKGNNASEAEDRIYKALRPTDDFIRLRAEASPLSCDRHCIEIWLKQQADAGNAGATQALRALTSSSD